MQEGPAVYTGVWIDHSQIWLNKCQVTVTTQLYASLQLIIGVVFGLAAPFLSDILVRCKEWWTYWRHEVPDGRRGRLGPFATQQAGDAQRPLLPRTQRPTSYGTDEQRQSPESQNTQPRSNALYSAPFGYLPSSPSLNRKSSRQAERGWQSIALAFGIYVVVSVGWALAGGFSNSLPMTSSGLSASTTCGSWSLRADATWKEMDSDDMLQAQKETRAGQYGRDCYGERSIVSPNRCTFFNNRSINYDFLPNQACPFTDSGFCANGVSTAARFSTGWVDASVLGLNSPNLPQFNRTTVCVPLNLDRGFIKQVPPFEDSRFDYYLGITNDSGRISNYTYRQFGDPFKWDVPAYSVSAYESTPYPDLDYWIPLPELGRDDHTYLTVLFIASCRIVYTGPSQDYIFHADVPFSNTGSYWNPDPRARPLACVDWTEIRSSDGNSSHIDEEHTKHEAEYEFVRSALRKSTTFQSIKFRLGTGLIAQESVGDYESLPLPDDQWVLESKALFETSLARIQHDTLDIAVGAGSDRDPGPYQQDTLGWARGRLCGLYKFQLPKEYSNVNILATCGFIVIVGVLVTLGTETSTPHGGDREDWFTGNMMVFELISWAGLRMCVGDVEPLTVFLQWVLVLLRTATRRGISSTHVN